MSTLVSFLFLICGWIMILGQAQPKLWGSKFWIIILGGGLIYVSGMMTVLFNEVQR